MALRLGEALYPSLFRGKLCKQPFGYGVLLFLGKSGGGVKGFLK
jgi:hypothetical protein